MTEVLAFDDLERAYDLIAQAIDAEGPEKETLFLSKLCLTLAHNISKLAVIEQAVAIAGDSLDINQQ
jgi:hypothetical protein